ncbi:MAG: AraC family transcriptional regulator [Bacteroidota bacterium]|nr:AraC family transcriptional regulator [Bacteroidota bacterium]
MKTGQEKHISSIESTSTDDILIKVTGREEVDWSPHAHNKHQIIYILSGTLHIEVDDISYFVTDRHLIWIPSGVSHHLSSNNLQISLLVCYFYIEDFRNDKFSIYGTDELIARNLEFISTLSYINRYKTPETFSFAISFFRLLPNICIEASFPTLPFFIAKDSRLLPVLEYINANINQDLNIEGVASRFGFSVRNLTRLFTNSDISFVHYLNYLRVVRAIEILTDNMMNIEQTSYKVGFNSPNSFYRVFKQITGKSPSMYIRKL